MFAITFDHVETQMRHPKSLRQAYRDVEATPGRYGFFRVQHSTYHCDSEDLANLYDAISALKALTWFPTA